MCYAKLRTKYLANWKTQRLKPVTSLVGTLYHDFLLAGFFTGAAECQLPQKLDVRLGQKSEQGAAATSSVISMQYS
jgi:hypothetical protein